MVVVHSGHCRSGPVSVTTRCCGRIFAGIGQPSMIEGGEAMMRGTPRTASTQSESCNLLRVGSNDFRKLILSSCLSPPLTNHMTNGWYCDSSRCFLSQSPLSTTTSTTVHVWNKNIDHDKQSAIITHHHYYQHQHQDEQASRHVMSQVLCMFFFFAFLLVLFYIIYNNDYLPICLGYELKRLQGLEPQVSSFSFSFLFISLKFIIYRF